MKFYFSIVSHHDQDIICRLNTLSRIAKHIDVVVICRDNTGSDELKEYCCKHRIHYIRNDRVFGFARNNNLNFLYAQSQGMSAEDFFIVLNPDIHMDKSVITQSLIEFRKTRSDLLAPNLYLNKSLSTYDHNLRTYPKLSNFIKNYLLDDRSTVIDKSLPIEPSTAFWASGAFLVIRARLYAKLEGFDEGFYLYCEDVDFCSRARQFGHNVEFLVDMVAIHYHRRASKKFLSREFFHHVRSVFVYAFTSHGWRSQKSCLKVEKSPLIKKERRYSGG